MHSNLFHCVWEFLSVVVVLFCLLKVVLFGIRFSFLIDKHIVLRLECCVRFVFFAQNFKEFGGLRKSLSCNQTVCKLLISLDSSWDYLKRQICIYYCFLIFHKTLPDTCPFKQKLIVKSVVVLEHASRQLLSLIEFPLTVELM